MNEGTGERDSGGLPGDGAAPVVLAIVTRTLRLSYLTHRTNSALPPSYRCGTVALTVLPLLGSH